MIEPVASVEPEILDLYDDIIDVRSPAEFAADHVPRAVNLPVLTNEERTEVGTIYVQESRFLARRVGAALIARNVARHLETALAGKPAKWRPLLYCWRGGQRSHAMATILSQIGWRVGLLQGGYKTWRRKVVAELHDGEPVFDLLLVDGATGSGKSAIIRRLIERGAQAIDLEALAAHRGSVFGAGETPQPPQRLFESSIWERLGRFERTRTIIVEAESAQIGRLVLPRRLWRSMRAARHVTVKAGIEARADHILAAYADMIADEGRIIAALERLKPFHAKTRIAEWRAQAAAGDWRALAISLMREHYDPLYARSMTSRAAAPLAEIGLDDLSPASVDKVARNIEAVAGRRS